MGCLFLELAPEMVVSLFCRIHLSHEFVFVHFEQQSSQKHRYFVKNGGGDNGRWIRGTSSHCAGGMRSARGTWSMIHCLPKCFLGVQCVGPGVLDASPSESELDG